MVFVTLPAGVREVGAWTLSGVRASIYPFALIASQVETVVSLRILFKIHEVTGDIAAARGQVHLVSPSGERNLQKGEPVRV